MAALRSIFEKEGPTTAGAIAYFSLFSILPALVLIFTICDQALGVFNLRDIVINKILQVFPGARPVIMESFAEKTAPSWTLTFISLLTFLWSASWVFMFVESALNKAWHVAQPRSFWRSRLVAMAMIVISCTLLAVSVVLTVIIASVRSMTDRVNTGLMPQSIISLFWQIVLGVTGFLLTVAVFTLAYKLIPHTRVRLVEALTGSLVASVLWQIANYVFAWYMPYFLAHQKLYGSLGVWIGLLSWVYFCSLIMLYGAHFSVNMHRLHAIGARRQPRNEPISRPQADAVTAKPNP